ncbi:MAG: amidohydrolase family protein [Planctomycetota bacterium]|jgi:predicted TIM-barrel fold metal-dependent hydrolase
MLVDFHVRLYDESGYGEALAETARNLGLDRLCISGGEAQYALASNAEVRRQAELYPELCIPFARVNLGEDGPSTVDGLRRVGFEGLCVWAPPAPYDDEAFFPLYEAAEALGMPIVFHTGYMPAAPLDRANRVRSANMRPVYLDTLARCFPHLKIVGVGLGSPWCAEAVEVMRYHPNVYFDLSGDVLRRKGAEFLGSILRPAHSTLWDTDVTGNLWGQIMFGSGVRHEDIASVERDYQRIFRSLALASQDVEAVMGHTAAGLLNIPADS